MIYRIEKDGRSVAVDWFRQDPPTEADVDWILEDEALNIPGEPDIRDNLPNMRNALPYVGGAVGGVADSLVGGAGGGMLGAYTGGQLGQAVKESYTDEQLGELAKFAGEDTPTDPSSYDISGLPDAEGSASIPMAGIEQMGYEAVGAGIGKGIQAGLSKVIPRLSERGLRASQAIESQGASLHPTQVTGKLTTQPERFRGDTLINKLGRYAQKSFFGKSVFDKAGKIQADAVDGMVKKLVTDFLDEGGQMFPAEIGEEIHRVVSGRGKEFDKLISTKFINTLLETAKDKPREIMGVLYRKGGSADIKNMFSILNTTKDGQRIGKNMVSYYVRDALMDSYTNGRIDGWQFKNRLFDSMGISKGGLDTFFGRGNVAEGKRLLKRVLASSDAIISAQSTPAVKGMTTPKYIQLAGTTALMGSDLTGGAIALNLTPYALSKVLTSRKISDAMKVGMKHPIGSQASVNSMVRILGLLSDEDDNGE